MHKSAPLRDIGVDMCGSEKQKSFWRGKPNPNKKIGTYRNKVWFCQLTV